MKTSILFTYTIKINIARFLHKNVQYLLCTPTTDNKLSSMIRDEETCIKRIKSTKPILNLQ